MYYHQKRHDFLELACKIFATFIIILALILASNNQEGAPKKVQCYANKKFMTGFIIALLLADRQHQSQQYGVPYPVQSSYSAPAQPSVYIIPVGGGY